jgi:hypothetical protein
MFTSQDIAFLTFLAPWAAGELAMIGVFATLNYVLLALDRRAIRKMR